MLMIVNVVKMWNFEVISCIFNVVEFMYRHGSLNNGINNLHFC